MNRKLTFIMTAMFCITLILVSCSKDNDSDTQTGSGKVLEKKITKIIRTISKQKGSDTLKFLYSSDNQLETIEYYLSNRGHHNGSYSLFRYNNSIEFFDNNTHAEDRGAKLSSEMENGRSISINLGKMGCNCLYTEDGYLQALNTSEKYKDIYEDWFTKYTITNGLLQQSIVSDESSESNEKIYKFEYSTTKNNLNLDIFYFICGDYLFDFPDVNNDITKISSLGSIFGKRYEYLPSKIILQEDSNENESNGFDVIYNLDGDYIIKIKVQYTEWKDNLANYQFFYE